MDDSTTSSWYRAPSAKQIVKQTVPDSDYSDYDRKLRAQIHNLF